MHEIMHRWSDGYGTELTFTMVPQGQGQTGTPFCFVTWTEEEPGGDIFACPHDLRTLAAAANAMADLLDLDGMV